MNSTISRSFGTLENLESRALFSAAVQDIGYAPITWKGQPTVAKSDEWIVRLSNVNRKADKQVKAINDRIGKGRHGLHASKFLGQDGLTLVQTAENLSFDDAKASLQDLPGFVSIEPNFVLTASALPNDPYFSLEYGLHNTGQNVSGVVGTNDVDIDAPEAWTINHGNKNTVVGVIDSGVDYTHPDLANQIWTNPNEVAGDGVDNDGNGYVDDIHGWDFYGNDNDPKDENGHGTHVAGTIAATSNNGIGVAGVADVSIMPLRFLGPDGSGDTAGALAAVNYATNMLKKGVNVRVTNNSWGGGGYTASMYNAIKANGDAGGLFIAAAGNGGSDGVGDNNDAVANYPSNYNLANVIAVAATDSKDARGTFSNYGKTTVDLAAPGVMIASTYLNGGYVYLDGTSMATPHVSGAAALAFSYAPAATNTQVKSALMNGVDPVTSMSGKSVTGGRLNAQRTLQLLAPVAPVTPTAPTATGKFEYKTKQQLKVTYSQNASSVAKSDFVVTNQTTGQAVATTDYTYAYDSGTNTGTLTFTNVLGNGVYNVSFAPSSSASFAAAAGTTPSSTGFFVLDGDANHDGTINSGDFTALVQGFAQQTPDFTTGDFNYDGVVNALDFNHLASGFGTTLTGLPVASSTDDPQPIAISASNGGSIFSDRVIQDQSAASDVLV